MESLLEIKNVDKHFDISGTILDQLKLSGGKGHAQEDRGQGREQRHP